MNLKGKGRYTYLLVGALLLFVVALLMLAMRNTSHIGSVLIACFLCASLGVRGFQATKGLSFTLLILAVVTTALSYPEYFLEMNGFELAELITPLIQLIMFGMGTSMGLRDFIALAKAPKSVLVGVVAQFSLMPLIAFFLASVSGFSSEISAGLILLGCAPVSVASPVMAYLARANVALCITIVSVTTLLAPLVIPLLMKVYAGGFIPIAVVDMMWGIVKMVLLPIGAGLLFNKFLHGRARWLDASMPLVSMGGIALIVAIIMAAGRESLLSMGLLLVGAVLLLNLAGYLAAYWMARLFRLQEQDCRTISITTGMQNAGLVSGIAKEMGKIATVGLASAVCGPLMGFTSSVLASYWSGKKTENLLANDAVADKKYSYQSMEKVKDKE
ncbi:bile acid:Na+ symporter, BASS family [Cyclobacterium xiamenense]|uniref:Bile acid:Na+ symporter, BASS family n=1 Tax=Cyclobacterium xiamenense TaxID=1297121 RepID=A0A1H6YX68_9BACT|nr:bile acid:sodium symporter family protein [Cyclobacterium xiamenense]SEJ45808.1 bile acid:Na+ symporter, BASS family [Cyclobacterium xiamenense]